MLDSVCIHHLPQFRHGMLMHITYEHFSVPVHNASRGRTVRINCQNIKEPGAYHTFLYFISIYTDLLRIEFLIKSRPAGCNMFKRDLIAQIPKQAVKFLLFGRFIFRTAIFHNGFYKNMTISSVLIQIAQILPELLKIYLCAADFFIVFPTQPLHGNMDPCQSCFDDFTVQFRV